ncbi:type IV secretory system conjugative DNA transfer family protein [Oscillospiraceae bacterium OttesenSCG-928-F05]|nr:type IV secretory system conjugative DNA transfer family protein [Oscillospiraceae bacterium OttesenSCG-928-F05]
MFRFSTLIEKLEARTEKKMGRWLNRHKGKLWKYVALGCLGLYVYSMFVNSIRLGIEQTFGGGYVESIFEWNPFKNLAALVTPVGLGTTFFLIVLYLLITKKGYHLITGRKVVRDPRGFDVLPDGTHGTSGWMQKKEYDTVFQVGAADQVSGTLLGKHKDSIDDDDKYADYIATRNDIGLNEHVLVVGASGTGKSRGFVRPFAFQCAKRRESVVFVDPKAELYESLSGFYEDQGYTVRCFNLLDMEFSDAWNVIADTETDKNLVQSVAEIIIRNTSNADERHDFWENAEHNLLMALLHYVSLLDEENTNRRLPIHERSLGTIYELLSAENFEKLDRRMTMLPDNHPAKAPYGIFRLANRQIWGNIAIGLGNRLSVFQNEFVDRITRYNEIDLELPGRQPCAYFCIISDQDSSMEFMSSLFFSMLFARLTNYARRSGEGGRLPVPVNVCLDEFCNVGKLLDFNRTLAVARSRRCNCILCVQSLAALADRYPRMEWEELVANCDVWQFLGANDKMTAEYLSSKCGFMTIQIQNSQMPQMPLFSPVYSTTRPYSQTNSNYQRPLMMSDEILRLPNDQSIILLRGQKPAKLYKITPEELPQFETLRPKLMSDHMPEWRRGEVKRRNIPAAPPDPAEAKPVKEAPRVKPPDESIPLTKKTAKPTKPKSARNAPELPGQFSFLAGETGHKAPNEISSEDVRK